MSSQKKTNLMSSSEQDKMLQKAISLHQSGQLAEAEIYYTKLLKYLPKDTSLLSNLGTLKLQKNNLEEGIKLIEKSLKIDSNQPNALNNLGVVLQKNLRPEEAIDKYDCAIAIVPGYAEAYSNRGNALMDLNRFDEALESYNQAVRIKPDYALAYSNRGNILKGLNRFDEALKNYNRAIALNPKYANAYANKGDAFKQFEKLEEAILSYDRALNINPNISFILGEYLNAKMRLCLWNNLPDSINEVVSRLNNKEMVVSPFALLSMVDDPELQRKAAEIYVNSKYPKNLSLPEIEKHVIGSKIRVGYFSADFRDHAVSHLSAGLYELHDRGKFEVHAFSFGPDSNDEFSLKVKAGVDHYHDVRSLSDKDVVILARSLNIDIAVDLGGFTQGSRTGIFAIQAAPIQVNYLGYSGTMGTDYIDYIIADKIIVPEDKKHHYAENIVYLPNTYMVTDSKIKSSNIIVTKEGAGLPSSGFVFCCFNNHYKIAPDAFLSWMRILKQVDGSVLWLSNANISVVKNLKNEAIKNGIDSDRLIFAPTLLRKEDHLNRLKLADLFIDTLPYNAHTTSSDALQMGLPVLTCIGNSFTGRVAASLLGAVKLSELIVSSQEDYETMAIDLATNPEKLNLLRDKLANNLKTTPLFNTSLFATHLESAYLQMHQRYIDGKRPAEILV
jgi:protein O-GlcNAc transferase